jgi:hypothetical protein
MPSPPKRKNNNKVNPQKMTKRDNYVVEDARAQLEDRIRNQAAHAAFSTLFPTWQIVGQ